MTDAGRQVRWPLATLAVVALLAGLVGGLVGGLVTRFTTGTNEEVASEPPPQAEERVLILEESAVTEAVDRAIPAVVTVVNDQLPVQDVLGRLVEETAVGSGVIIDERGYIVTNEHVVRDSDRLTVVFGDGTERGASLISDDYPFTDLAVIRVEPGSDQLESVPFGDSDALTLGQTVVAVGTALFEFDGTVTVGVVSGLHRRWSRNGVIMEDLVQTDAAVNHGNSGGALLNTQGELVGLNTTVIRSTEDGQAVEGVAFAISSNTIAPIAQAIVEDGSYARAYLGVVHRDLTSEVAGTAAVPVDHGALILDVSPDTAAAEADLRPGDIIVRMGDYELGENMPFINALARLNPHETVPFVIYRDDDRLAVDVTMDLR